MRAKLTVLALIVSGATLLVLWFPWLGDDYTTAQKIMYFVSPMAIVAVLLVILIWWIGRKEHQPLGCATGYHTRIFLDAAFFTSADRCGRCGEWLDPDEGARVDRERELWSQGAKVDNIVDELKIRDAKAYQLARRFEESRRR